jgi:hypothetical protein
MNPALASVIALLAAIILSTAGTRDGDLMCPRRIAVFSGYPPHRSSPNRSDRARRLLCLSYRAFSDGGEQRDHHYAEFADWLKDRYAEYGKTMTYFR